MAQKKKKKGDKGKDRQYGKVGMKGYSRVHGTIYGTVRSRSTVRYGTVWYEDKITEARHDTRGTVVYGTIYARVLSTIRLGMLQNGRVGSAEHLGCGTTGQGTAAYVMVWVTVQQ